MCFWIRTLGVALATVFVFLPGFAAETDLANLTEELPQGTRLAVPADQFLKSLSPIARSGSWQPEANEEISRGPSAEVFPRVAPATVVVRTPGGWGTGFVVSEDGWIVTNHHVVEAAGFVLEGDQAGAQTAMVHTGRLKDGVMQVDEAPIPATIYKLDKQRDLALLKLGVLPIGITKMPTVKLAEKPPAPGNPCVVIGHPKAGMLWTVRSGEVAGVGVWPKDMIAVMLQHLSASATQKEQVAKSIASEPSRKVLISTCGINPGDSGGPLLNEQGELVGVTFAIPKSNKDSEISLDKFSYHVHLDEAREFIRTLPATPPIFVPSIWPPATAALFVDRDEDGINDSVTFIANNRVTGISVDADQNSGAEFKAELAAGKRTRDTWDAEFVIQPTAGLAFYDKDNDGQFDEILVNGNQDPLADLALRKTNGAWSPREVKDQKLVDFMLFADKQIGDRVKQVLDGKGRKEAGAVAKAGQPVPPTAPTTKEPAHQ